MNLSAQTLHIVVGDLTPELKKSMPQIDAKVCVLTDENAREVLDEIFATEHIAVWGQL